MFKNVQKSQYDYKIIENGNRKHGNIEFSLFLHACDTLDNKIRILVYNLNKKTIEIQKVKFYNWFYIYPSKSKRIKFIYKSKSVKSVHKLKNVKLSEQTDRILTRVYKIYFKESDKTFLLNEIKNNDKKCEFFEINICRSIRFVTNFGIRFLEKILIKNECFNIINTTKSFFIPIYLRTIKNGCLCVKIYQINQNYELLSIRENFKYNVKNFNQENKIICCWNKQEEEKYKLLLISNDFNDLNCQNCFIIYLHDLILNFLRISDNLHEDRIKIHPMIYFELKRGNKLMKRFIHMYEVFQNYFQQLLYVTKFLSIPIYMLLKVPNRKMISDMIYLSEINKNIPIDKYPSTIICSLPKDLNSYKSNSYIEIFSKSRLVTVNKQDDIIVCVDYTSMYPSMMLNLFENNPKLMPYYRVVKKIYELKQQEKDPRKKHVYKVILNAIYGSFGVKWGIKQFLICGNIFIAKKICSEARELLELTIEYFKTVKKIEILYCNTDSIVIKGNKDLIQKTLNDWNKNHKPFKYRYTSLNIERTGQKILFINKQVRIWVDDGITKFIGWNFNSVSTPAFIRKCLKKVVGLSIIKSNNFNQFKKNFVEESEKILEESKTVVFKDKKDLNNLMSVTRVNKNKNKFKNYNNERSLDLRFTIELFSSMDESSCINESFEFANIVLYNISNRNFRIEKRLFEPLKSFNSMLNRSNHK